MIVWNEKRKSCLLSFLLKSENNFKYINSLIFLCKKLNSENNSKDLTQKTVSTNTDDFDCKISEKATSNAFGWEEDYNQLLKLFKVFSNEDSKNKELLRDNWSWKCNKLWHSENSIKENVSGYDLGFIVYEVKSVTKEEILRIDCEDNIIEICK